MTKNFTKAEAERETGPYPITSLDKLKTATRAQLVQGMGMDKGTVAAIVGQPSAGKTAFAVSLGVSLAAREALWLGCKIMPGPVCYFAAEAPGSVTRRAKAAARRVKRKGSQFHICTAVPGLGGKDTTNADTDRIIATVQSLNRTAKAAGRVRRIKMIFLDTVASIMGDGDENSDGMVLLVAAAKRIALETRTCVVLIHHPSKSDPTGLRGHGSLLGACDTVIHINIEDEQTGVRTATLTKSRDDASGLQLRFELEVVKLKECDSWGDPQTTVVVKLTAHEKPRQQPKGKQQQKLLVELECKHIAGETSWQVAAIRKMAMVEMKMGKSTAHAAVNGLLKGDFLVAGSSGTDLRLKHPPIEMAAK